MTEIENKSPMPSFLAPECEEVKVGERAFKVYPVSLRMFCGLKTVLKPVLTSLAALLVPAQQSVKETLKSPGGGEKTTFEPIPVEIVKVGLAARERAISELVDAFMDPKNVDTFRAVIVDALRDDVKRGSKPDPELAAQFAEIDLPTAIAFAKAIVQLNMKAIASFMKGVTVESAREMIAAVAPSSANGITSS